MTEKLATVLAIGNEGLEIGGCKKGYQSALNNMLKLSRQNTILARMKILQLTIVFQNKPVPYPPHPTTALYLILTKRQVREIGNAIIGKRTLQRFQHED